MNLIEELLEKPYWVIDFLPEQVPADSEGQFFAVEQFYLQEAQRIGLQKKFLDILLKLNCYYDFEVYLGAEEEGICNPEPAKLEAWMMELRESLTILLPSAKALVTSEPDDLCMAVYDPDEKLLNLISRLAAGEGLYVWNPEDAGNH